MRGTDVPRPLTTGQRLKKKSHSDSLEPRTKITPFPGEWEADFAALTAGRRGGSGREPLAVV